MTENKETLFSEIKKDFFRFRNGVLSQSLRNQYPEGVIIYGLMVPQFLEMAKRYPKNLELGEKLWDDKSNRESRLFALYILPSSLLSYEKAEAMIMDVRSVEEAEFLAFRILRHLPFRNELYENLKELGDSQTLQGYCVRMFAKNINAD